MVRLGAMGDVLHALPAVAMLRRALPEARIGWVVEQRWRELLCAPEVELAGSRGAGRPLVDEVHLVDTRGWRKRLFGPETRREFQAAIQGMQARAVRRRTRPAGRNQVSGDRKAFRSSYYPRLPQAPRAPRPLAV